MGRWRSGFEVLFVQILILKHWSLAPWCEALVMQIVGLKLGSSVILVLKRCSSLAILVRSAGRADLGAEAWVVDDLGAQALVVGDLGPKRWSVQMLAM